MYFFTKSTMNFIAAIITSLMCLTLGTTACKNETPSTVDNQQYFKFELSDDKGWVWHDYYVAYSPQILMKVYVSMGDKGARAQQDADEFLSEYNKQCQNCLKPTYFKKKAGTTIFHVLRPEDTGQAVAYSFFEKDGYTFEVFMTGDLDPDKTPEQWGELVKLVETMKVLKK